MKRLIVTSFAAVLAVISAGTGAALAQPYQPPYAHPYGGPPGHYGGPPPGHEHYWHHGDRFYGHRHFIDWRFYHLRPPPYGYRWIQDGPQFLLLNIDNGFVADVVVR